jgi:hypothetical protein
MGTDRRMPSDKAGRVSDQQGWYHGKRLPSLDGAGVLIHWVYKFNIVIKSSILHVFGGEYVARFGANKTKSLTGLG